MAFQLLRGLSTLADIDLCVILLNEGRLSDELQIAGIPTYVLDERKRSFPVIVGLATKEVRSRAPHILHSHRYKENILSYLVSLTLRENAALVSTQHGMPELYDGNPGLSHRLKSYVNFRLLATRFDKMISVSADIKESLIRDYGFQESNLEIIRNGIVIPELVNRVQKRDDFVIGSVGRLVPVKDYPLMVEVAKAVNAKTDKIRFELAGDGPMLGNVQDRIHKCGLEQHFALPGFIREVSAFYEGLDVYLNTSLHEGIPMSVLEAMAHGVPPIAPRVGGFEEIVTDGVDGYLVDGRNPQDFAEKCLSLYRNPTLRQSMGQAAREKVVQQFSVERMTDAYLNLYTRAMAMQSPRKH